MVGRKGALIRTGSTLAHRRVPTVSPLARKCLHGAAISVAVVAGLALMAGMVRLLPWFLEPGIPWPVVAPFARALGSVALETAIILGVPTGFALGTAAFVERGEARALQGLGQSPVQLVLGALPWAVAGAVLVLGALVALDVDATEPGQIARELVRRGRSSCLATEEARAVKIPMVNLTWLCWPAQAPRVSGPLPAAGGGIWFSAAELTASQDLREFELQDLRLALRGKGLFPETRVRVKNAHVTGLPAWGRPSGLRSFPRAALVVGVSWLSGLFISLGLLRDGVANRIGALALGAVSGLISLALLHRQDSHSQSPLFPALLAVLAVAIPVMTTLASRGLRHQLTSWRQRRL